MFRRAVDARTPFILQGNSSAVAAGLIEAVNKHNDRVPNQPVLFLNYSAVDPTLTNERCSPWHFRFDAHVEMRMAALVQALRSNAGATKVYLLNQDYSFGREVAANARVMLDEALASVRIVGDELHPVARSDFALTWQRSRKAARDTVVTGNWGNDLTLLVRAALRAA